MVAWLNRAVFAAPRNGTNSHTITPSSATNLISGAAFTPTAGRLLVVVIEGAVTSTTPSGWTLPANGSAINNTGLYVWHRTAAGSDTFTTTHNGSNYPVAVAVYEFPAGSTFVKSATATGVGHNAANPNLTALTGTNLVMGAKALGALQAGSTMTAAWSGTGAPVEDIETVVGASGTDGYTLTTGYVEAFAGTSWQPTAVLTVSDTTPNAEALTFAIAVAGGVTNYDETASVAGAGSVTSSAVLGKAPTATATGAGSVATALTVGKDTTASLNGAGNLAGAAVVGKTGTTTISGAGILAVTVVVTSGSTVTAAINGAGTVAATAQVAKNSSASIAGTGTLAATAVIGKTGAVALAGTGNVAGPIAVTTAGQTTATVTGAGQVTPTLIAGRTNLTTLTGTGSVAATISIGKTTAATLTGVGEIIIGTIPMRDLTFTTTPQTDRWTAPPTPPAWATAPTPDRWNMENT